MAARQQQWQCVWPRACSEPPPHAGNEYMLPPFFAAREPEQARRKETASRTLRNVGIARSVARHAAQLIVGAAKDVSTGSSSAGAPTYYCAEM